jgi:hypothetical protein
MQLPIARKEQIISETVAGEYILYDTRQKRAHRLNPTLSWIWDRCDGNANVEQIAAAFEGEFAVENGIVAVLSGLKQLDNCELLQRPIEIPPLETSHSPFSRRQIIASGSVLMPVLVSIIAPTPAAAKSGKEEEDDKDNNGKHKGQDKEKKDKD